MSTLKVLKEYLVGEDGYLLNDDNNGKTVMLSGAWGSGKTHFWQNEIVRKQSKIIVNKRKRNKYSAKELKEGLFALLKKKKKTCVYISLYGKDNIEDIKSEVFTKAYAQIPKKENKDKNIDTAIEWLGYGSKIVSAVSVFGVKIDTSEMTDGAKDYQDNQKLSEAQEAIRDGGVICFDDFERKSKHIDLNDLFGVLTQLSLEFNCKVVIILNSDAFEGEEANIFKTVKEKTVNKYFYFEPTVEELFKSIYNSDEKYKRLDGYKDEIFKAIIETREKNARIYSQVLDDCLEWLDEHNYNQYELRALVLITTNFLKNHFVFEYRELEQRNNSKLYAVLNRYYQTDAFLEIAEYFIKIVPQVSRKIDENKFKEYLKTDRSKLPIKACNCPEEFLHSMHASISKKEVDSNDKIKSDSYYEKLEKIFQENKNIFYSLNFYAYLLDVEYGVDREIFNKINQFVRTGILPKTPKEVESSLPPKVDEA